MSTNVINLHSYKKKNRLVYINNIVELARKKVSQGNENFEAIDSFVHSLLSNKYESITGGKPKQFEHVERYEADYQEMMDMLFSFQRDERWIIIDGIERVLLTP